MIRNLRAAFFLFLCFSFQASVSAQTFKSEAWQTTLLEVFSSEGCSSCPEGDAWVGRMVNEKGLWKDFIPAVFHVDYWDQFGWKDPFSRPFFTERQRSYAISWGAPQLYTPNFVINGKAWDSWRNFTRVPPSKGAPGVLTIERLSETQFRISFAPASGAGKVFAVRAALLGFDVESRIGGGENAGRVENHQFVVLDYARVLLDPDTLSAEVSLSWNGELAAPKKGIVAWVAEKSNLTPLQAAGGYLN